VSTDKKLLKKRLQSLICAEFGIKKKIKYAMDTDDLSREAYNGILIEAGKLSNDLTLHYGLLSGNCENETEYLDKAEKMTKAIMQLDSWELEDLFWGNPPDKNKLIIACERILKNIENVKTIPIEKRNYDF
jgi:hypothetical protein